MVIEAEGWFVLRLHQASEDDPRYRIFASWRANDRWRLSSGALSFNELKIADSNLIWPQVSGNTYQLPFTGESGATYYTASVLERYLCELKTTLVHVKVGLSELTTWASYSTRNDTNIRKSEDFDYETTFYEFYALCSEFFRSVREAIIWFDTAKLASFGQRVPREIILEFGMSGMVAIKDYLTAKSQGSFE
ncbi:hypothetical protein [Neiella marina]|nr:hypothetical protein [Neiella marina]